MKISTLYSSLILIFFLTTLSHQATFPPSYPPQQNPRLQNAFLALQALKHAITSDPKGFTSNWYGPYVCNYTGVYCAPAPDNPNHQTVAGIDLNHADISGYLPEPLGLLKDLTLFHINSNHFSGTLPQSFSNLRLLYELDISNNIFSGEFPQVVFSLPSLKFLDIRFNQFQGDIPSNVFNLKLDALFINNNNFQSKIPENIGNSPVSVFVLANNNLKGCFPASITKMANLNELILSNSGLSSCLPYDIGALTSLTVFDVSFNTLTGPLPESIGRMKNLEQLNVAHNQFSGKVPASICYLPRLENFTFSDNYFYGEAPMCSKLPKIDDRKNCLPERPLQRIRTKHDRLFFTLCGFRRQVVVSRQRQAVDDFMNQYPTKPEKRRMVLERKVVLCERDGHFDVRANVHMTRQNP
ncbi:leucine-rich repeat extensin-like protein 6 [Heracleum sosnowskyi]|uniref:Cell wall hydroxyproline-rich glycoprotein n=1 Tax=Heracleum sosnowskyi TaxID=360622 RepID=A0AAD8MSK3_9APIA|nr:leucine-rich repeat extensin-like protein 6 [Heracleum sosnowskyi]